MYKFISVCYYSKGVVIHHISIFTCGMQLTLGTVQYYNLRVLYLCIILYYVYPVHTVNNVI